ncbi:GNAT family N-acetyltransferase [Tamlana crocina]
MIVDNPFTSKTFTKLWSANFIKNQQTYHFDFINGVSFFKPRKNIPLHTNLGQNLTKGISYQTNLNADWTPGKKKTFLIYDIPEYSELQNEVPKSFKLKKIRQYTGFITQLGNYKNFDDYFQKTFSKKSRYKFKSYQRNLENCFDVKYVHYLGSISKQDYDLVFDVFYDMLKKRFDEKSEANNNLEEQEWTFYYNSVYELILEKKASLFVIYQAEKPIAISLNYLSSDILFFAMTSFDIDYYKFNLGKIHLMELFKWCFENNIKTFDFSKGYYDYKERWGDKQYHFYYHILYDAKSIPSTLLANGLSLFLKFKQYARDKNLTQTINKFKHYLTPNTTKQIEAEIKEVEFNFEETPTENLENIPFNENVSFLNKSIYDFLYLNNEHISNFTLYKIKNSPKIIFVFKGKNAAQAYELAS